MSISDHIYTQEAQMLTFRSFSAAVALTKMAAFTYRH